jgi:hypothetical protein
MINFIYQKTIGALLCWYHEEHYFSIMGARFGREFGEVQYFSKCTRCGAIKDCDV